MPNERIVARFATLADLDFVTQDRYVSSDILRRKIEWHEVVVAERDGKLVGYVRIEYLWSIVPYISLIRVPEEYRRQGIGKLMLGYLEDFFRSQGHETLFSSSQENEAEPQAWHRHNGFEDCGFIAGVNQDGARELFFRKQL